MDTEIQQPQQQVELDLDRQQKAKEYARIRRRLSYVSMGIGVVGIFILLFTNLDIWLGEQLQRLSWQPIAGWVIFSRGWRSAWYWKFLLSNLCMRYWPRNHKHGGCGCRWRCSSSR